MGESGVFVFLLCNVGAVVVAFVCVGTGCVCLGVVGARVWWCCDVCESGMGVCGVKG